MKIQTPMLFSSLKETIKNILVKDLPAHFDLMESKREDNKIHTSQTSQSSLKKLTNMGFLGYSISLSKGGFDLGESVTAMVCEEVGNYLLNYPYLNTITAADILMNSNGNYDEDLKLISEGNLTFGYAYFAKNFLEIEENQKGLWVTSNKKIYINHYEKMDKIMIRLHNSFYVVSKYKTGLELVQENHIGDISCYTLSLKNLQLELDEKIELNKPSLLEINSRLRLRQASYLIGLANGALNQGIKYVNTRRQFDKRLIDNQSISFKLASLIAQLDGAKHKIQATAAKEERKVDIQFDSAQSLALAAELALEISRECLHYHGAFGMTQYSLIEKYFKLISIESVKYDIPNDLWLESGRVKVASHIEKNESKGEVYGSYNETQTITN